MPGAALLVLLLAAPAQTQAPSTSPTPALRFPGETAIVHVDAVITDRKGKQITDLTASDLEIEVRGGRRFKPSIATYVPLTDQGGGAPVPAGQKLRPEDVRRVIAFVVAKPEVEVITIGLAVDTFSSLDGNMFATQRIDRMLKRFMETSVSPTDLVAIVNADSRKPVLNQFTATPEALNNAIETLRKEWHNPDTQPIVIVPPEISPLVRYSADVFGLADRVVSRLENLPGRRMLFLVSAWVGIRDSEVRKQAEALVRHANRAGVTIYGVSPGGPGSGYSDAFSLLASGTGGSTIENTNLVADGMDKIMERNRGYYLIGFDPEDAAIRSGQPLKVRVNRDGARVSARPVAQARSPLAADERRRSLEALLDRPISEGGLPLRITPFMRWTGPKTGEFSAVIDIDPKGVDLGSNKGEPSMDLDVLTRVIDARGVVVKSDRMAMKSKVKDPERGVRFMIAAAVPRPGFYQVDVAIEDKRSGKTGSGTALTSLKDLSEDSKRLVATDLLLHAAGAGNLMPEDTFRPLQGMALFCRVAHLRRSGDGGVSRLRIQTRIERDGRVVLEFEPQVLEAPGVDLVDVQGEISIAQLEDGDYVARVELTDLLGVGPNKQTSAKASFRIRK